MREREIIHLLSDCTNLLSSFEISSWASTLEIELQDLKRAYASGGREYKLRILNEIHRLYGGMGSFGDIYICPQNNKVIKAEETTDVNRVFRRMQEALYEKVEAEILALESEIE